MQPQTKQSQKSNNNIQPNTSTQAQMQQSYQLYNSDQAEMQTAQFIKTNTLIQNNNNNNIAMSNLQNSQQSSSNQQQKKNTQSSHSKKNSTAKEPMTLSINQMILQNQSICQGINEESLDKSYLSQGNFQPGYAQRINEKIYLRKKLEKMRYKDKLRCRNIIFLAILIFIYQADSIYIFSQNFARQEINQTSKILFFVLVIAQIIASILFILLGCKTNDLFQEFLKRRQKYLGLTNIVIQIAYFESVCIVLDMSSNRESELSFEQMRCLSLIQFRLLNIFISQYCFSMLIRNNHTKLLVKLVLLIYICTRLFYIRISDNYILIAVSISTSFALYLFLSVTQQHSLLKQKIKLTSQFQRLLNSNNVNLASNNITINGHNTINNHNNINVLAANAQSSVKGSPPEKNIDDNQEILKQQSFNNHNVSLQASQMSYPFIFNMQPKDSHQYQKSQSLNQNVNTQNSYHKIMSEQQQILNTNNNQIISYNSLSGSFVNLEKPLGQSDTTKIQLQPLINKSKFGIQSNHFDQNTNYVVNSGEFFNQNNQLLNKNIQNILASENQHQMSKISELDLENDFSKHNHNNSQMNQNLLQNGFSTVEQKSLIDQLIEVDGVLVFEQETQYVVFANQNILSLLETDSNKVLQEVMTLKQVQFSTDEKTPKDADYSTSNLLKHLFKDSSNNPLIYSPVMVSQNNSSKTSNKMGSNPLLNRVIEEENEQDHSPQTAQAILIKGDGQNPKPQSLKMNEQQTELSFQEKMVEEINKTGEQKQMQLQQQYGHFIPKALQQVKSLLQNNSLNIPRQKKENHTYTKSRSHNYKTSPSYLSPNSELLPEDEDDIQKGRPQRNESIFKKLSPHYNSSENAPVQNGSNQEIYIQPQNANELHSFLQNRHKGESLDFQFPSFISSISHLQKLLKNQFTTFKHYKFTRCKEYNSLFKKQFRPRKSTMNQNSFNTFERDRNNTLKDIMDDVRSKSGTFLAQHRKSTITQRKKTLNTKKQLNYSQQPETIINNMVLFKENTSKIYLLKYSIVEHAGKVLHIISIRDLSNEVFEQILDRQNSVLIDELYKYLNFTEISQILNKSVKQMKDLKYKIQVPDYKIMIQPIKLNLRLFKYLMNDIFDIRSLQHRSFLLNKDYFDLQQELLQVKKMTENLRSDIVFNFYYDKLIPIQILNDKERITQILMNLLVNCYKLVKNNKIFLKAKMCKEQNLVKIIIQNRELNKSQKEQILKAFTSQNNSLGYHFFISNLLVQQVSNQKYKLEIISNKQEYVKFKFHIFLYTHNQNDTSQIQLIKPSLSTNPQQGKTNSQNTISTEKKNDTLLPRQYLNSLSHLDLEENDVDIGAQMGETAANNQENKINESPPTHLDKGQINNTSNLIKDSKSSSNDNKQPSMTIQSKNKNEANRKTIQFPDEMQTTQNNADMLKGNSAKTISNEGTEMSEQVENTKIKDFNSIQNYYPMKFIADLTKV